MAPTPISAPMSSVDTSGRLTGEVHHQTRTLGDLAATFADSRAFEQLPPETVAYRVESLQPVEAGTRGGLFFGTSFVEPGTVGDEYFMTRGHFHDDRDASEMYWGISGTGCLVMRSESGNVRVEPIRAGTVHYVPGRVAHRVVNIGDTVLAVGACWPADAGHDYDALDESGFGVRVVDRNGVPTVVSGSGSWTLD